MTIKELIAELSKIQVGDQDQEIVFDEGGAFFEIEKVVSDVSEEGDNFYYINGSKIY